jgi:hypothetical protein
MNLLEISSIEKLISCITSIYQRYNKVTAKAFIIGIDGYNGSGKSYIAKIISTHIHGELIHLDSYTDRGTGVYVKNIDDERLLKVYQKINKDLRAVIFDGICLLQVLEYIDVQPDLLIYIKHYSSDGYWIDDRLCDSKINLEDTLAFIKRMEPKDTSGIGNLDREIAIYHHTYNPIEKSQIIFSRIDS